MQKRKAIVFTGFLIVLTALILSVTLLKQDYALATFIIAVGTVFIFFCAFENKNVITEKIVLIAILCSLSIAGRVLFAALPSVQAASFIIIIAGIVFGGEIGFMTGAVTAFASNMILGQGPWTPWQMFCWGMMGFLSGVLSAQLKKNPVFRVLYGLVWGFLFGWIMNLWFVSGGYLGQFGIQTIILAGVSSFFMDLGHGVTNAVLLLVASSKFIKVFNRIALKYGLAKLKEEKNIKLALDAHNN